MRPGSAEAPKGKDAAGEGKMGADAQEEAGQGKGCRDRMRPEGGHGHPRGQDPHVLSEEPSSASSPQAACWSPYFYPDFR